MSNEEVKDGKGYTIMPNSIKLFENKKKSKDSHPDYTGKMYDTNGNEFYVSCWTKETKSGDTYLSGKVVSAEEAKAEYQKSKDDKPQRSKLKETEASKKKLPSPNEELNDDLPF